MCRQVPLVMLTSRTTPCSPAWSSVTKAKALGGERRRTGWALAPGQGAWRQWEGPGRSQLELTGISLAGYRHDGKKRGRLLNKAF